MFPSTNLSRDLHDRINIRVVKKFELGLNDYRLYREGIISFYHVYEAFERIWKNLLSNPSDVPPHIYAALQALSDPRLLRTPQIAADLEYYFSKEGGFDPKRAPDTLERKAVVEYIEKRLTDKPHLVLAYAHIYYMALFAGGKILVRMMLAKKDFFPVHKPAGNYEEAKKFGTNMFLFPVDKGKEEGLRNRFKDAMCEVEGALTEAEKTEIIQEARQIYLWNEKLVNELESICEPMVVPLVLERTHTFFKHHLSKFFILAIFAAFLFWFSLFRYGVI
ncbi:hypothetical protein BZA77DRAFT_240007 [Pyronema omphalodes]|nr:hypothetical protein BZA77DRAFT_240007 [Pyronema omphalodes]